MAHGPPALIRRHVGDHDELLLSGQPDDAPGWTALCLRLTEALSAPDAPLVLSLEGGAASRGGIAAQPAELATLMEATAALAGGVMRRRKPLIVRASGRIAGPLLTLGLEAAVLVVSDGMEGLPLTWEDRPLLLPGTASSLVRRLGRARALEVLLAGRAVTAAELVEQGGALPAASADDVIAAVSRGSRVAQEAAVDLLRRRETGRAGLEALERAAFALAMLEGDRSEGVRAFLEKRAPVFGAGRHESEQQDQK